MRLTNKQIIKELKQNVEATITTTENVSRDIYLKFAEFEDFIEEQGFESLEDMKNTLKKCEDKYFKMQRDYEELKHCIWKDTPIQQIRNNYERGHNFDFVGVAYNRGKAKIDSKVRQENQALKDRWQKLKEWVQKQSNPINNLVVSNDETKYVYMSDILDEMQELEKENKWNNK